MLGLVVTSIGIPIETSGKSVSEAGGPPGTPVRIATTGCPPLRPAVIRLSGSMGGSPEAGSTSCLVAASDVNQRCV